MARSTSSINRHDSHSTTAQGNGWSTKRIAVTALFCAVAAICTLFIQFPIFPAAPWLMYDPSGVVALVAGFAFGPAVAAVVSILPYLVHLGTSGGFYGTIMAVVATLTLAVPAALIYRKLTTRIGALVGMIVGGIACLVACILANLLITPLYAGLPVSGVAAMIVPVLLPFNLLKIVVNCVITALIYKPITKALGD